jgi:hypothetical protein
MVVPWITLSLLTVVPAYIASGWIRYDEFSTNTTLKQDIESTRFTVFLYLFCAIIVVIGDICQICYLVAKEKISLWCNIGCHCGMGICTVLFSLFMIFSDVSFLNRDQQIVYYASPCATILKIILALCAVPLLMHYCPSCFENIETDGEGSTRSVTYGNIVLSRKPMDAFI